MTTADENGPEQTERTEDETGSSNEPASSGEPCIYCPTGHFEPGDTTITLERSGTTLVVKKVPGKVCWACGEALFTEKTVDHLQDMMERAVEAGVETAIRTYATETDSAEESATVPKREFVQQK